MIRDVDDRRRRSRVPSRRESGFGLGAFEIRWAIGLLIYAILAVKVASAQQSVMPPSPQQTSPSPVGSLPEQRIPDVYGLPPLVLSGLSAPQGQDVPDPLVPGNDNSPLFGNLNLTNDDSNASEPDITKPGPDMGDYPNSAYTLPKGRAYVEFAPVTYQSADKQNSASYNAPFMLRYGVTDNVEFRLIGSGLTAVYDPGDTVVGLSPLILDTKVHLWDDQIARLIPAASLEVYVETNWGSPTFQGGVQPSINLNLDFPITKKTNIEMTFGYSGVQDTLSGLVGHYIPRFHHTISGAHLPSFDVDQFAYQWAIEHQVSEKFQVFLHGYFNGPILLQSGPGKVIGVGYFYQISKRVTLFNSFNGAVDNTAPPFSTQVGMALAF